MSSSSVFMVKSSVLSGLVITNCRHFVPTWNHEHDLMSGKRILMITRVITKQRNGNKREVLKTSQRRQSKATKQ